MARSGAPNGFVGRPGSPSSGWLRALRILHRLTLPTSADTDERLAAEAAATRALPGCREAEAYRGLSPPDEVAVVQLWEDEDAHDAYAAAVAAGTCASLPAEPGGPGRGRHRGLPARVRRPGRRRLDRRLAGRGPTDRLARARGRADRDPVLLRRRRRGGPGPARERGRDPARARLPGVRLAARGRGPPAHPAAGVCGSPSGAYDQHWILRRRTGSGGPARQRAERAHGSNGAEFYRRQEFRLLYGRWLPRDDDAWSTTVDWPA